MTERAWSSDARQRLRASIEQAKSHAEVARKAGLTPSTLSAMLSEKGSEPSISKVAAVASAAGVSLDYVLTGSEPTSAEFIEVEIIEDVKPSAGPGANAPEFVTTGAKVPFPRAWCRGTRKSAADLGLMQVAGDSMSPTLQDGDWILIDRSLCGPSKGIYVAIVDDVLVVKNIQRVPGRAYIQSDSMPGVVDVVEGARMESMRVVGKVIWSGKIFQ